jgi:hypothetical protein
VIQSIALRLTAQLRQSDTVVRWGGEEFLIITRESATSRLHDLAEKLRLAVSGQPFPIEQGIELNRTICVGFVPFPFLPGEMDQPNWAQVLALADSALYLAKNNGRNRSIGIAPGDRPWDRPARDLLADLAQAVSAGYLRVISQGGPVHLPAIIQEHSCSDPSACPN